MGSGFVDLCGSQPTHVFSHSFLSVSPHFLMCTAKSVESICELIMSPISYISVYAGVTSYKRSITLIRTSSHPHFTTSHFMLYLLPLRFPPSQHPFNPFAPPSLSLFFTRMLIQFIFNTSKVIFKSISS